MSEVLGQAMQALRLADVWELAPDGSEPPRRDGLRKSPFREDAKPSFSVFADGTRFKDQSTADAGGVWVFVRLAKPEWSKADIARYLVERAGLEWEDAGQKTPEKKSVWKRREEDRQHRRMAKEKQFRERKRFSGWQAPEVPAWPDCVRRRWEAGLQDLGSRPEQLARKRGWPIEWMDVLEGAVLRWPALPWSEKRFAAFLVQLPDGTPVGYHQQTWTQRAGKGWLFVPYVPSRPSGVFTRQLQAASVSIPPLPFVIGSPSASLWIIAEGQWDAITIYGALGGFEDAWDMDIAVFGLRGAEAGPSSFLAYYGERLRRQRPHVWLMPDNDEAGRRWDASEGETRGNVRPVSFVEEIQAATRRPRVPVTRVKPEYGKDFNDYWRAALPSRQRMMTTLERTMPEWNLKQR